LEEAKTLEADRQRAEVFDALGHPTRILILKALSEGTLGFAELKKKTGIESSGHLQHHLNKLEGLIKNDDYGRYCLSDHGRDALLTVQTVEQNKGNNGSKRRRLNTKMLLATLSIVLAVLLITASMIAVVEHSKVSVLQQHSAAYHFNPFNVVPDLPINDEIFPHPDVYLLSPENRTYNETSIPVVFSSKNSTGQIFLWVAYSLDGQANVTLSHEVMTTTGPILANLTNGNHNIVLFVRDNHWLYAKSDPIAFTVETKV
jgi:DNA-binding HxlR family transcriptional regulator